MLIHNRFTEWLARRLINRALWVTAERRPDLAIGPPEDPYMLRWFWLPRNRLLNVYVHFIRHDDDDRAPHDHPWWSARIQVAGGPIIEHLEGRKTRMIHQGSIVLRSRRLIHRLALAGQPRAITLFSSPARGFASGAFGALTSRFIGASSRTRRRLSTHGPGCGEID